MSDTVALDSLDEEHSSGHSMKEQHYLNRTYECTDCVHLVKNFLVQMALRNVYHKAALGVFVAATKLADEGKHADYR